MKYTALAAALLVATSSAYALDARINTGLQLGGMGAQADVGASVDLKAQKEAAAKAAAAARDHAIHAGASGVATGKSAAESGHATAEAAKTTGTAAMNDAKAQAAAKLGAAQASTAGFKQSAEMKINATDRLALAKHYATGKATSSFFGKLFGSSDASAPAAGYESKLVLGAKLDSSVAKSAVSVDASAVSKLSAQPKGTDLLKVGDHIVRVDAKTQVVLDVAAISPK
ncbi:MAG: hypothetical protein ABIR53_03415 [Paraperlucidibaca sp.]